MVFYASGQIPLQGSLHIRNVKYSKKKLLGIGTLGIFCPSKYSLKREMNENEILSICFLDIFESYVMYLTISSADPISLFFNPKLRLSNPKLTLEKES